MRGRRYGSGLVLALGAALLALALAACSRAYAPGSVELSPTPIASAPTRSNSGGGVDIKVRPLAQPVPGMKELRFEVVMDTHSVDLDQYNPKDLAVLRFGTGPEVRAAAWAAVPGGHHVEGTITFSDAQAVVPADAAYLELVIRNLAGVAERVFRWELR